MSVSSENQTTCSGRPTSRRKRRVGACVSALGQSTSSKRTTSPEPNSSSRSRTGRSRARPDAVPGPATRASGRITAASFQKGPDAPPVSLAPSSKTASSCREACATAFGPSRLRVAGELTAQGRQFVHRRREAHQLLQGGRERAEVHQVGAVVQEVRRGDLARHPVEQDGLRLPAVGAQESADHQPVAQLRRQAAVGVARGVPHRAQAVRAQRLERQQAGCRPESRADRGR